MQTLKQVKIEMYNNMKKRSNWFLSEDERYTVENLESVDKCLEEGKPFQVITYTEDEACDIVCQSLDGIDASDTENAFWEVGYIRGYEVALIELYNEIKTHQGNNGGIASFIKNLLDN